MNTITDEQIAEIEAAADAFPDYEWDSNTEPFFNGPSGESLGGGSTGLYCVYGQPFEIDGETYDGPTLVEACPPSQAKFICEAKPTIKALIARLRAAEKDAALLKLYGPIIDEVERRAEKECCLQDRCDFTVTVSYDDYAAIDAAMAQPEPNHPA